MSGDRSYSAFGLTIASNVALPGLRPAPGAAPSVRLDYDELAADEILAPAGPPARRDGCETLWRLPDGSVVVRYDHPAAVESWLLRVDRDATVIEVRATAGLPRRDVLTVVETAGIACALSLRGVPILHACTVDVDGAAVAVVGASGAGKSTTAAAFLARGYRVLSDDMAPLRVAPTRILVRTGAPRLRLYPEAARAAGLGSGELPRLFTSEILGDKRTLDLAPDPPADVPLAAIYVLERPPADGRRPPTRIGAVSPRDALALVLRHTHGRRWLGPRQQAELLPLWARLVREIPVRRAEREDDLAKLDELPAILAADARNVGEHPER